MPENGGKIRSFLTNVRAQHEAGKEHPFRTWFLDALVLNLFVELLNQRSLARLLRFIFTDPIVFAYNTLLIMVPLSLAFFFRKRTFARVVLDFLVFFIGLTNGVMLTVRVTPFNAADLRIARFAVPLANQYLPWWAFVAVGVGLIGVVIGLVWLWRHTSRREPLAKWWKITVGVAALVFLTAAATQVGQMTGLLETRFANLHDAYRANGMPYCFMCSIFQGGIDKPHGYSEEVVVDVVGTIEPTQPSEGTEPSVPSGTQTDPAGQPSEAPGGTPEGGEEFLPNIIFVQLESYFDITEWERLSFSEDPIPVMRALAEEFPSGLVSVPSVGAGTANTEFEMITGMNLDFFGPGEYPYQTVLQDATCESMPNILRGLGYRSHAVHNHIAPFYDRYLVYPQLGFDDFISIEYMNGLSYNPIGWAEDAILTREITDALNTTPERDYVYCVSVQGHGKYPEEPVLSDPPVAVYGAYDEAEENAVTFYVSQLYAMDRFVGDLTDALSRIGEPCVCVFYGDHLPMLDIEAEEIVGGTVFQTPYVVWNNCGLPHRDRDLESYQMSAWVQDLIGMHEGVMPQLHERAFAEDLYEELPEEELTGIAEKYGLEDMDGDGILTRGDLYLYRMKLLEYDILYGSQTSLGGQPYPPSDMRLGLHDIVISRVTAAEGGSLYVYGSNFTTSSVIYDGSRQLTTTYLSPWLLSAEIEDRKAGEEMDISVVQYTAAFHIPLSSTDPRAVTVGRQEGAVETPDIEGDPFFESMTGSGETESED